MLLYLLPKREFYKNMKFKHIDTRAQVRPRTAVVAISLRTQGGSRELEQSEPRQGQICWQQRRSSSDQLWDGRPGGFELLVQQQAEAAACPLIHHSVSRKVVKNNPKAILETDEMTSE